jgi:hypothetical protein
VFIGNTQAVASYARQAKDEERLKLATRIRDRAYDRCGELLQQLDARDGRNLPKINGGGDFSLSQREAAERAGLSLRQQITAGQIANIPREEFESLVESDNPPTITELAERGKKSRPPKPPLDQELSIATNGKNLCASPELGNGR